MLIDRFAAGLVRIGVKPQDQVMLYIPNCPQWIIANFAINKIGAVMVPVSPIYTAYRDRLHDRGRGHQDGHMPRHQLRLRPGGDEENPPGKGHRHQPRRIDPPLETGHRHALRQDPEGQDRERQRRSIPSWSSSRRETGRSRRRSRSTRGTTSPTSCTPAAPRVSRRGSRGTTWERSPTSGTSWTTSSTAT